MDELQRQEALAGLDRETQRLIRVGRVPSMRHLADRLPSTLHVVRFLALEEGTGRVVSPYSSAYRGHVAHHEPTVTALCDSPHLHPPGEPSPGRDCKCGIYGTTPMSRRRVEQELYALLGASLVVTTGRLAGPILTDPLDPQNVRGATYRADSATVFTDAAADALRSAPGGWADIPITVVAYRPPPLPLPPRPRTGPWFSLPRANPRHREVPRG